MRRYTDKGRRVRFVLYRGVQPTKWQAEVIYPIQQKNTPSSQPPTKSIVYRHSRASAVCFKPLFNLAYPQVVLSWDKQHSIHYFPFSICLKINPFNCYLLLVPSTRK